MKSEFSRVITLLRKEKNISQKQAAAELGISQALLSHYENGIRECGLGFLVKCADFYGVSCDYLLGRSADRDGTTLSVDEIPEPDMGGKENVMGSAGILPVLNKKLIANSLNILFDQMARTGNRRLITAVSEFLMLSVLPDVPAGLFRQSQEPAESLLTAPGALRPLCRCCDAAAGG